MQSTKVANQVENAVHVTIDLVKREVKLDRNLHLDMIVVFHGPVKTIS